MYTTIAEFINDWDRESGISLKNERALTDQCLGQKSDPEGSSLGKIAWHLAGMIGNTGAGLGLQVVAPPRGTPEPSSAKAIADAYETAARTLSEQASKNLKDKDLSKEIQLFGRSMTMAAALQTLMRHQIHHRGQMTVLMRMAGVVVPGVYGPAREESKAMAAKQAQGR